MAQSRIAYSKTNVTVGVDTHSDIHVAAAFATDGGRLLGHLSVEANPSGYRHLWSWARSFGASVQFGIEGTGSFGLGLTKFLRSQECNVFEVTRPNRQMRYARGKSDTVDAEAAAQAVLSGAAQGIAKDVSDQVGMIRALRVARRSAIKSSTLIMNQVHALIVTSPDALREQLRPLTGQKLVAAVAALRPGAVTTPLAASKFTLRSLGRQYLMLAAEIASLDTELERLTEEASPRICAVMGVGTDVAGAILVAAGDNPERLRSEAAFAKLCGVAPLPASSGKTTGRHRLNRGGDRTANNALWRIVMTRLAWHEPTKTYVQRRTAQGLSKREIVRCLKRYVAREIYHALVEPKEIASAA